MAMKVIDVSRHNGEINWEDTKGEIDGVIIRCGYGDDIASQDDERWKYNADACVRLGIPFGVYLYSYADSTAHAKSEAEHVLCLIKGYKLSYPVYYDLEDAQTVGSVSGDVLQEIVHTFATHIEQAGYWCGLYANYSWFETKLANAYYDRYTKWIARYASTLGYNKEVGMWQYTSTGSVAGISGNVDISHCYRDFPKLIGGENAWEPPKETEVNVYYRVRTKETGWLEEVRNLEDYAGYKGYAVTDIAVRANHGSVRYRVHVKGEKWLPYVSGYDTKESKNGYAGNGRVIDAIEIYYYTPESIRPYQKIKYRIAPKGGNYYPWQYDTEKAPGQDGYAGVYGKEIVKFQAIIE